MFVFAEILSQDRVNVAHTQSMSAEVEQRQIVLMAVDIIEPVVDVLLNIRDGSFALNRSKYRPLYALDWADAARRRIHPT